jgi:hypothetical protein
MLRPAGKDSLSKASSPICPEIPKILKKITVVLLTEENAIIDREYTVRGPFMEIMGWYWRLAMGVTRFHRQIIWWRNLCRGRTYKRIYMRVMR